MADSVMGSRRPPPPSPAGSRRGAGGPRTIPISCNKCRKPLSTTVFVCSCDCVFCEECTYNHFNTNSHCPTCNRTLTENDFTELVVADPSATQTNSKTTLFQNMFTKQNPKSRVLSFQDMCTRALRQQDDTRGGFKFLMKQFLIETTKQAQRFQQLLSAFEALKNEFMTLKQSRNSEKMRYEKAIQTLQQQLAASNTKIEERDRQLYQFRKLHDGIAPGSPHQAAQAGGGSRRVSHDGSSVVPGSARQQQAPPPMQGFMIQKENQERARQRAMDGTPRPPIMGHPPNPYSTPRSRGSQGSGGGGGGSGGIRDLSNTGYAFSGAGAKRQRAMSPSQAFNMQPPGSYSVSKGPTNYFQHQQGYSNHRR